MKMKNIVIQILSFILLASASFVAYGSTLQGKLEYFGENGLGPASFIAVTLHPKASQRNPQTANSGSDGMYYFKDVQPGDYILKVWVNGFEEKSIDYEIRVPNQEEINIKKIVTHSLKFEKPGKGSRIIEGTIIKPRGTYYSISANASLWIAFSDLYNNLYFSDNPVVLHKDGTWTTTDSIFIYPSNATKISVVMITEEESKKFKKKVSEGRENIWPKFTDIPINSYFILASCDIRIVTN